MKRILKWLLYAAIGALALFSLIALGMLLIFRELPH